METSVLVLVSEVELKLSNSGCTSDSIMRVFPKAIVLTTKSHINVKKTYTSIRGLVVRTIALGKTRISAIVLANLDHAYCHTKKLNKILQHEFVHIFSLVFAY